jgi:hypothetical protein
LTTTVAEQEFPERLPVQGVSLGGIVIDPSYPHSFQERNS